MMIFLLERHKNKTALILKWSVNHCFHTPNVSNNVHGACFEVFSEGPGFSV